MSRVQITFDFAVDHTWDSLTTSIFDLIHQCWSSDRLAWTWWQMRPCSTVWFGPACVPKQIYGILRNLPVLFISFLIKVLFVCFCLLGSVRIFDLDSTCLLARQASKGKQSWRKIWNIPEILPQRPGFSVGPLHFPKPRSRYLKKNMAENIPIIFPDC